MIDSLRVNIGFLILAIFTYLFKIRIIHIKKKKYKKKEIHLPNSVISLNSLSIIKSDAISAFSFSKKYIKK